MHHSNKRRSRVSRGRLLHAPCLFLSLFRAQITEPAIRNLVAQEEKNPPLTELSAVITPPSRLEPRCLRHKRSANLLGSWFRESQAVNDHQVPTYMHAMCTSMAFTTSNAIKKHRCKIESKICATQNLYFKPITPSSMKLRKTPHWPSRILRSQPPLLLQQLLHLASSACP